MKNFLNNKLITGGIIILVLGTIFLLKSKEKSDSEKSIGIGLVIRQDLVQRVTIAGTVTPLKKTVITAPYSGYVKKIYVKIGDLVKRGDPIVSVVQSLQGGDDVFPLRSPLDGVVVQVEKSEGESVKEYDQKDFILRIDDISKLFVVANAPEIDRVKIKENQDAIISASAIIDRKYKGIIRELSLAARAKDEWGRSQAIEFPIKIEIIDQDEVIKPGMSVVMDIITARKSNVLTLRHEFIHVESEKYYVLLESGKRKDIQVGAHNEEGFEIVSGLNEGERIKLVNFSELSTEE